MTVVHVKIDPLLIVTECNEANIRDLPTVVMKSLTLSQVPTPISLCEVHSPLMAYQMFQKSKYALFVANAYKLRTVGNYRMLANYDIGSILKTKISILKYHCR